MMQGNQMFQNFPAHQFPMFADVQGGSKPGGIQTTAKVQTQDDSHSGSTPVVQDKVKEQQQVKKPFFASNGLTFDQKFKNVICYKCGEPCHYVGMCPRPKKCFICGSQMHHMDKCPEWYRPMPMAQFYGSASLGLGFFHVEVDKPAVVAWLNMDNVGIAIVDGEITMEELKQNFSDIWKTNWPWQMRRLDEKSFLVRFPPGKKIKDLVSFPSINLKKKGVSVSFMDWNGDIPAYSEMEEVWVRVEGIPPKYLSWRVMMRVTTALGIPIDVDWHEIFRSFYKVLRIKVDVRDITKIPGNRLMEFGGRNFMPTLAVIQDPVGEGGNEDGDDPDNNQENDNLEDDMGRDDDLPNDGGKKPMETEQNEKTPRTAPTSGGSVDRGISLQYAQTR
jgi:hypothetical protein